MHTDFPCAGPLELVDGETLESTSHIEGSNPDVDVQGAAEVEEHAHAFAANIHHNVHELRLGQGLRDLEWVVQRIDGWDVVVASLGGLQ
ncbi:hypothetical protein D7U36_06615 [Propionibacterium australiense]|uniref:Uncharacterized protein n=1 Tax=Propionibacterium australiense TaxID=119981 RepID=A0A8B3FJP2_9ACTN|nr:hypothetical protein D7U36_06615 [Propionibacterium australiense]